jgi:hypothetical protein
MYSGPHFPGRVGTTQRAGTVEADRSGANRFSDTHSRTNADAIAHPNSYAITNPPSSGRVLCRSVERHADLSWG